MIYEEVKQETGMRMGKVVTLSNLIEKASCVSKISKEVVLNNRKELKEGLLRYLRKDISHQRKQQEQRFWGRNSKEASGPGTE